MTNEHGDGDGIQALFHNLTRKRRGGWAVLAPEGGSCEVTLNTGNLGDGNGALSVTAGDALLDGAVTAISGQTVDIGTGDALPRKDVIYLDGMGTATVAAGVPETREPAGESLAVAERPAPSALQNTNATVLAIVLVPADAVTIGAAHLIDLRARADQEFGTTTHESAAINELGGGITSTPVTNLEGANLLVDSTGTLVASDTNTQRTNEEVEDIVSALLAVDSNLTITYDDVANTLTVALDESVAAYSLGADVVVYTDAGTITAVGNGTNGATRGVISSGTDAATVIQAAINDLATGGTVFIRRGDYTISAPITPTGQLVLAGAGTGETRLTAANSLNDHLIKDTSSLASTREFLTIRDLLLDGNKANNTSGDGIHLAPTTNTYQDTRLHRVAVTNFVGNGFYTDSWRGNSIFACPITQNDGIGIRAGGTGESYGWISHCTLKGNVSSHINCEAAEKTVITQTELSQGSTNTVGIVLGKNAVAFGNTVTGNDIGIFSSFPDNTAILANIITANTTGVATDTGSANTWIAGNAVFGNTTDWSLQGTGERFEGVLGGGPAGGVDLSTATGDFDGERAMANGTSLAASWGDLAVWDDANLQWLVFTQDATV